MTKITEHVIIPLAAPGIFFAVTSLPVHMLGCRTRGMIAGLLAIAAGILAVASAVKGLIGQMRGEANTFLWMISAVILAMPAIFIVLLAI